MPHVPLVQKPSSLEADLPLLPRKPRNVARKCTVKKPKVSEATGQEVSTATRVVEYLNEYSIADDSTCVVARHPFPRSCYPG
jgi:hypothetical protein